LTSYFSIELRRQFNIGGHPERFDYSCGEKEGTGDARKGTYQLGTLLSHSKGSNCAYIVPYGLTIACCQNMALSSFQLFISQVQSSPAELKLKVLQVIFDLLVMYEQEFFGRSADVVRVNSLSLDTTNN
jgi:hypothetical protein